MKARTRLTVLLAVIASVTTLVFGAGNAQASTVLHKNLHWSCNPTTGHTLAVDQYWTIVDTDTTDTFTMDHEDLNTVPHFYADRVEFFWQGQSGGPAAKVLYAHGGAVDGVFNVPPTLSARPTLFGGSGYSFTTTTGAYSNIYYDQYFSVWANGPSSCADATPVVTNW
jgi:hypothetical protein